MSEELVPKPEDLEIVELDSRLDLALDPLSITLFDNNGNCGHHCSNNNGTCGDYCC